MDDENAQFVVVINDEEQYSIWFAERRLPAGWRSVDKVGTKAECLQFIEETWTDMRPRSVRERAQSAGSVNA